jgi:hypothetical protein
MGSLFSSAILGCEARFRSRRIEKIAASSTSFRMPNNPNFIETEKLLRTHLRQGQVGPLSYDIVVTAAPEFE